jgi:hypothetical protein
MPWNSLRFMQELNKCGNQYQADNAWFRNDWGEQRQYTLNAWRLYQQASTNALGMLLLGSAKIRKDSVLVSNFGMTSAGGITDPEEVALVNALEAERTDQRAAPGLRDAPDVLGPGSILNEKNWTPLLNDCYVLGGVHGEHEFHLAEDSANAYFESLGGQLPPKEKWQSYFRTHLDAVWDTTRQAPRILARELIGLKTFGYRAQFSLEQLSFSARQADGATFKTYLDALVAAGITSRNRTVVLETLSLFLFGNAQA